MAFVGSSLLFLVLFGWVFKHKAKGGLQSDRGREGASVFLKALLAISAAGPGWQLRRFLGSYSVQPWLETPSGSRPVSLVVAEGRVQCDGGWSEFSAGAGVAERIGDGCGVGVLAMEVAERSALPEARLKCSAAPRRVAMGTGCLAIAASCSPPECNWGAVGRRTRGNCSDIGEAVVPPPRAIRT